MDWTIDEVNLVLRDYFQMLEMEINGQHYVKAHFRKSLRPLLNNRSEGSIEFKHQNISAVLMKYKMPYIIGYKPLFNYQMLLEDVVLDNIEKWVGLKSVFDKFSNHLINPIQVPTDYSKLLVPSPKNILLKEPVVQYSAKLNKPDYIEIEQRNMKLGELGEEMVMGYEKWRLIESGHEKLAEEVEWVSKESGDGAGFDILSRNSNGTDRYIEVKTTKLGELTPFYFSSNELRYSRQKAKDYYMYRVFKFNKSPNLFIKNGSFDDMCEFEPTNYVGRVG